MIATFTNPVIKEIPMAIRTANYPGVHTKRATLVMECAYVRNGRAYVHISSSDGWIISEQECSPKEEGRAGWQKAIACAVLKVLKKIPEWKFETLQVLKCRGEYQANRRVRSSGVVCFCPAGDLCPGDSNGYFKGPLSFARMLVDAANFSLQTGQQSTEEGGFLH